jgi:WD40 repeat protein
MTYKSIVLGFGLLTGGLTAQSDLFKYAVETSLDVRQRPEVIAFSPEGTFAAIGTNDGSVFRLDLSSGSSQMRLLGKHPSRVTGMVFTRDGSLLITASESGYVQVTSTAPNSSETRAFRLPAKIRSIAVSPDKAFFAAATMDNAVTVWDINTTRELYRLPHQNKKPFRTLGFAGGGTSLFGVTESGEICEWDTKTRSLLRQMQDPDNTVCAAVTSNAASLLSISTEVSAMSKSAIRNGGTGGDNGIGGSGIPGGIGGPHVGGGTGIGGTHPTDLHRDDRVKIYDLERGAVAKVLDGILGQATALSASADDRFLALVRQYINISSLDVYDVQRGVRVASIPLQGSGTSVAFSPDGLWLGSATDKGRVTIYSVTGVQRGTGPGDLRGVKIQITSKQTEPLIAPTAPLKLAVMDFETNLIDREVGRAVADFLRNRINGVPNVTVVERRQWDQLIKEQNLQFSDRIDPDTAVRLGRGFGVGKMIFGSVSKLGSTYTINVRLIDVETQKNDGEREVICQRCTSEDLPEAVAVLKTALIRHD